MDARTVGFGIREPDFETGDVPEVVEHHGGHLDAELDEPQVLAKVVAALDVRQTEPLERRDQTLVRSSHEAVRELVVVRTAQDGDDTELVGTTVLVGGLQSGSGTSRLLEEFERLRQEAGHAQSGVVTFGLLGVAGRGSHLEDGAVEVHVVVVNVGRRVAV